MKALLFNCVRTGTRLPITAAWHAASAICASPLKDCGWARKLDAACVGLRRQLLELDLGSRPLSTGEVLRLTDSL